MKPEQRKGRRPARRDAIVRVVAVAALMTSAVYLTWRASNLWANAWLSIPLFLLEGWGLLQLTLLTSQGWRQPQPSATPSGSASGDPEPAVDVDVDVVITCTFHDAAELERSLIACRSLRGVSRLLVVARAGRPELLTVAAASAIEIVTANGNHVDLFLKGVQHSGAPLVAWIEAGQVPMPDFLEACVGDLDNPSVAVVQARHGMLNKDSLAALRGGRDEDAFRFEIAYPAEGRRGAAPWLGGGSVVRAEALHDAGDFDTFDQAALERALVRLHQRGWLSHYQGQRQLVLDTAPDSLEAYLTLRRRRAIEALRVYVTPENPLRAPGLRLRHRMQHVAHGIAYLASIRQLGLTLILAVSLLSGTVPFAGSATAWAAAWVPTFLLGVAARKLLARGTMDVGDWTRQGWRTLAGDLSALAQVVDIRRRAPSWFVGDGKRTAGGFLSLSRMRLVTWLLLTLDAALTVRGLTVVRPLLLPRFTTFERVFIIGIAVVVIVSMIDVLQVAVQRKQRRLSYRVQTKLPGMVGSNRVRVVDLSPAGFGAKTDPNDQLDVGDEIDIQIGVPGSDQQLESVRGRAVVRSIISLGSRNRIGVEFSQLDPAGRERLIGYCAVGHNADATGDVVDLDPGHFEANGSRRRAIQLASGVGIVLGAAALLLGPAAVPSLADVASPVTTCLSTSTGDPLEGATVSFRYNHRWNRAATTGADGCVTVGMPPRKTGVAMDYRGVRNRVRQDLSLDPLVFFQTVPVSFSLTRSNGDPIAGGLVQYRAKRAWHEVGSTTEDGTISTEMLPSKTQISLVRPWTPAWPTTCRPETRFPSTTPLPWRVRRPPPISPSPTLRR